MSKCMIDPHLSLVENSSILVVHPYGRVHSFYYISVKLASSNTVSSLVLATL